MKRKTIGVLLAGVICAISVAPAGAVHVTDIAGLGALAAATAAADVLGSGDVNAAPPVQDAQSIGFRGLGRPSARTTRPSKPSGKRFRGSKTPIWTGSFLQRSCNIRRS